MPNTSNNHIPTIVYVEDNEGDALLLEEAFREGNHAALLLNIASGDEAFGIFKSKPAPRIYRLPTAYCWTIIYP